MMSNQTSNVASAQALVIISDSFERFKGTVTLDDAILLTSTTIQNVLDALVTIQHDLRRRRENRNLRKLYPFLEGLRKYGQVMDTLSNGLNPYMPWIWAPIKLVLQITSDHLTSFDKLIEAYSRISDTLPRLDNIGETFKDNPIILLKLALYYADILEFHRRAYKFIRRKSWKFFFMTTWAQFDVRFNAIIDSMAYHSDLVTKEATAIDIIEARRWRERLMAESEQKEKERNEKQRLSVISWLGAKPVSPEDICERLLRDYLPGSCDWVDDTFKDWFENDEQHPTVWLHGKPGAGKSVLCASMLNRMEGRGQFTIFYFCTYLAGDTTSDILKSIIIQLIAKNSDLAAMVYAEFVMRGATPSLKTLKAILTGSSGKLGLISGISPCRIVIDGLDECNESEHGVAIDALSQLVSVGKSTHNCKLLLCSRNVPSISRKLQRWTKKPLEISLSKEHAFVNNAISDFVTSRLGDLNEDHPALQLDTGMKDELSQIMVDRSDGMFLWAKLVLDSISDIDSHAELHEVITKMPKQLPELYGMIVNRLYSQIASNSTNISRVFAWLIFTKRPLKKNEILHAVAITPKTPYLDSWNRLHDTLIDKCRPLVEELPGGTISLVHSTVQEYLMDDCASLHFKPATWRGTIAFACIRVLTDGLSLLDPQIAVTEHLHQIATGCHALLPYSIDSWVEHLRDFTDHSPLESQSDIVNVLRNFELIHGQLVLTLNRPPQNTITLQQDNSFLQTTSHLPAASICASIMAFREHLRLQPTDNGEAFAAFAQQYDPTLLSDLSAKYDHLVGQLLSGTNLPGNALSLEQLEQFRKQYILYSFRCRFSPCRNTSFGFASESARSSHEQLHVRRLFCEKSSCFGARTTFKTQQDLDRHRKVYHEKGGILIPARIRRPHSPQPGKPKEMIEKSPHISPKPGKTNDNYQLVGNPEKSHDILHQDANEPLNVKLLQKFNMHEGSIDFVRFSPDGQSIAVRRGVNIYIHDTSTGKTKHTLLCLARSMLGSGPVAFSPDSQYFAACGVSLIVWHINTELSCRTGLPKTVTRSVGFQDVLEFSSDGGKVVVLCDITCIRIWRVEKSSPPNLVLSGSLDVSSHAQIKCISFSDMNSYLAAGCKDGKIYVWQLTSGIDFPDVLLEINQGRPLLNLREPVVGLFFSLGGKILTTVTKNGSFTRWPWREDVNKRPLTENGKSYDIQGAERISHTPDDRYALSSRHPGILEFFDIMTGSRRLALKLVCGSINFLDVSKQGKFMVTADQTTVFIWSYNYDRN